MRMNGTPDRFRDLEGAGEVDAEHRVPVLLCHLAEGDVAQVASVVDPAKSSLSRCGESEHAAITHRAAGESGKAQQNVTILRTRCKAPSRPRVEGAICVSCPPCYSLTVYPPSQIRGLPSRSSCHPRPRCGSRPQLFPPSI